MYSHKQLINLLGELPNAINLADFSEEITSTLNNALLSSDIAINYRKFDASTLLTYLNEHLLLSDSPLLTKQTLDDKSCDADIYSKSKLLQQLKQFEEQRDILKPTNADLQELVVACQRVSADLYGQDKMHCGPVYQLLIESLSRNGVTAYQIGDLSFSMTEDGLAQYDEEQRGQLVNKRSGIAKIYGISNKKRTVIDDLDGATIFPAERALTLLLKRFIFERIHPFTENTIQIVQAVINQAFHENQVGLALCQLLNEIDNDQDTYRKVQSYVVEVFGVSFNTQKNLSNFIQSLAIATGFLLKIKRSKSSELCHQRFITIPWQRKFDLFEVIDGKKILVRRAKDEEFSRIRICEMPYKLLHGLSLTSSGFYEIPCKNNMLKFEWGYAHDVDAFLHNQFPDVEKIIQDALSLNPKVAEHELQLDESYYSLMQNPIYTSSQQDTQHMHIFKAKLNNFTFFETLYPFMDNQLSIKQIGFSKDAVMLTYFGRSKHLQNIPPRINSIRLELEQHYKKIGVHFTQYVIPDGQANFLYILIPQIALLEGNDSDYLHPITKQEINFPGYAERYQEINYARNCGTIATWREFYDMTALESLFEVLSELVEQ